MSLYLNSIQIIEFKVLFKLSFFNRNILYKYISIKKTGQLNFNNCSLACFEVSTTEGRVEIIVAAIVFR